MFGPIETCLRDMPIHPLAKIERVKPPSRSLLLAVLSPFFLLLRGGGLESGRSSGVRYLVISCLV